ncbi:MAG: hypothetical protein CM1200mP36_04160 [Gammaproteobacteria bacterium]|nr:MAG: hypothetical protein CM1200mP36_04160 [Gammaproteobacteria bacterium]
MNARIVAGVGNIYANESLFRASIHPSRSAGRISCKRLDRLVRAVRAVLNDAITAGGTTLQDFVGSDGRPGYFQLSLDVYDKAGEGCRRCTTPITVRTSASAQPIIVHAVSAECRLALAQRRIRDRKRGSPRPEDLKPHLPHRWFDSRSRSVNCHCQWSGGSVSGCAPWLPRSLLSSR